MRLADACELAYVTAFSHLLHNTAHGISASVHLRIRSYLYCFQRTG